MENMADGFQPGGVYNNAFEFIIPEELKQRWEDDNKRILEYISGPINKNVYEDMYSRHINDEIKNLHKKIDQQIADLVNDDHKQDANAYHTYDAYIPYIPNVDFNNEKMTNVPIDDPIRTLTVKLAGYKHDLIKVKEGYNKQVINYDEYQKFSLNLERKIASYEQALKILKQW